MAALNLCPRGLIAGLALLSLLAGGCHDRSTDFIPAAVTAESALARALEAWRAGHPVGDAVGSKPSIFVTDNNRQPGQALKSFRILGETPGRAGRTYAVQLDLEHPDQTIKTEYIVVGIDPLWVFRREDYELLMHWDHHMPQLPKQEEQL